MTSVITAADIRWTLEPLPNPCGGDVLDQVVDARLEAECYRRLAAAAIHYAHGLQCERDLLREQRWLDRHRATSQAAA